MEIKIAIAQVRDQLAAFGELMDKMRADVTTALAPLRNEIERMAEFCRQLPTRSRS